MTTPNKLPEAGVAKTLGLDSATYAHKRRWIWIAAALLLLALLVIPALGRKPQPVKYTTQAARRGNLVVVVSATGTLEPVKKVDVGIEVSGTINKVEADYNDQVKVGQVLARLDTSRLEAQAQQNEAALQAAQAKVVQAQASVEEAQAQLARLNRVKELSGGKMPSQTDLDTAKANLARYRADEASAKASVGQAQAALNVDRTDLTKAVITSCSAALISFGSLAINVVRPPQSTVRMTLLPGQGRIHAGSSFLISTRMNSGPILLPF
jgi:HlyD family secretion protein